MAEQRRGPGRPRELDDARTVPVKIEEAEIQRANKLARREGVTVAEVIRRALRAYLNRRRI
jgi:hypothetical protein